MKQNNIALARRSSGGGTVYHDLGNVNCTFVVPQAVMDRSEHLKIVAQALQNCWSLPVSLNERNDLVLHDKKISGSAYKISIKASYHHCTLLVDAHMPWLRACLQSPLAAAITSKSVASVRSSVTNMVDHVTQPHTNPLTVDLLCAAISAAYQRSYAANSAVQAIVALTLTADITKAI